MYGFNNGMYGADPSLRQRYEMMQRQQMQQQYPQNYQQAYPTINGRIVTGMEEARAAQIPLDGTQMYFPSPSENKVYVKCIGLDGMPVFQTFVLQQEVQKPIVYADGNTVAELQRRVEKLEEMLKGAVKNESDAVNTNVAV